ncbi:acyl--CoA ligase [Candidatus Saccharibacteria bacterium]|nr:acyl--CoA ligase [Candidatus Saccharibacteria bacterium]
MLKIKGQKKDPLVPPLSISALYNLSSFRHWDQIVVNQKEFDFTRRELKNDRQTVAKALLALGIKKGDIITVATGRSMYDNILIFLAANQIGAIVSFLDEKTPRETLLHYIKEFSSSLVVTYKYNKKRLKELKKSAKTIKNIINLDGKLIDEGDIDETQTEIIEMSALDHMWVEHRTIREIAQTHAGHVPKNLFGGKNEAIITFTSGSTSGPKPMVFTNQALIAAALFSKAASGIKMWDKVVKTWFSFVKFDCPYGFWTSVLTPIIGGSSVILTPDLDTKNFPYYFAKNINVVQAVPLLFETLPKVLPKKFDLSSVKMCISGGERLEKQASIEIAKYFKKHGATVKMCNGYGVGECLGSITVAVGSSYHPDTVGRVVPGAHVMVLDPETSAEQSFDKTGLLYISGKHLLKRYFNRPELTAEKILKIRGRSFINTGDLATVSKTGFVTLVGRATFFINTVPAKVYYEVVRAAIAKNKAVKNCYVVKMPDPKLGWAACAFIVLKKNIEKNNATRRKIAKASTKPFYIGKRRIALKEYEIPRKIVFLDKLPLTRANKTDFRKLEHMAKELATKSTPRKPHC